MNELATTSSSVVIWQSRLDRNRVQLLVRDSVELATTLKEEIDEL